ncbi:MAG: NTP transferase domain-containing protein, partial [Methylococcales bacterium]|nr:NTP transferase domain-containing protein [Methylococcales bacterium]
MIKSTSPLWVIIPIKSLARAKSRLTAVISMDERQSLSVMLLEKSLRMLQPLPNIRVVVISCDENARAAAEKWDAEVYCNSQDVSLNTALSAGYDYVRRIGGRRILILPADLPFVSAESIRDI